MFSHYVRRRILRIFGRYSLPCARRGSTRPTRDDSRLPQSTPTRWTSSRCCTNRYRENSSSVSSGHRCCSNSQRPTYHLFLDLSTEPTQDCRRYGSSNQRSTTSSGEGTFGRYGWTIEHVCPTFCERVPTVVFPSVQPSTIAAYLQTLPHASSRIAPEDSLRPIAC